MKEYITIKQFDTYPPLQAQFLDSSNKPINLSHANVYFTMVNSKSIKKIDKAIVTIVSSTEGKVKYNWKSEDTDTIGTYNAEFIIEFNDGTKVTIPNFEFLRISVIGKL